MVYFVVVIVFGQAKLWTHLLLKGGARVTETEEYWRYTMCLLNVFLDTDFFFINLKTKKGHLVKLYTVHQSMHKWQLIFLSHCLNFFSVFIEMFNTNWFIDGRFYTD